MAHVWHWHRGDGASWPDFRAIVGGDLAATDVPWADRMEERVAVVISWGLLDQFRRPVRTTLPCAELYEQFARLTGRAPLGPLEAVCVPDPAPAPLAR